MDFKADKHFGWFAEKTNDELEEVVTNRVLPILHQFSLKLRLDKTHHISE